MPVDSPPHQVRTVPAFARYLIPLVFAGIFLALATVALDKPGYHYDEVTFVPVSLRVLGQCDVDAAVTRSLGCYPLMQAQGYVGAVKAWLHAPLFAQFGVNVWTVRLPSILIGLAAILVLWSFARRELGTMWATLLLALVATDPLLLNHARFDWGPQMIATLMRVLSLAALWRWLQTGSMRWLLLLCGAFLAGFADKLNFIWVIGAWTAAAALVAGGPALDRLRSGKPWQPLIVGATAALLLWGVATLVRDAAGLGLPPDAGTLSVSAQLAKVWNLYAATFSGMSVIHMVFGAEVPVTIAFNVLLLGQFVAAIILLANQRPWTPAWRMLAFLTAAMVFLLIAIAATPQVRGSHHLVMLWPLPSLHLVTLLAISAQHAGDTRRIVGMKLRTSIATVGAITWAVVLAWHVSMDVHYVDAWRNDRNFRPAFDPAIAELSRRLRALDADRVIAVDLGLHPQLVTLAERSEAADFREWTRLLETAKPDDGDLRSQIAEHVAGKRVAFVLNGPSTTVVEGARERLNALLARSAPCRVTEAPPVNVAGKSLYLIVVADFGNCGPAAAPPR